MGWMKKVLAGAAVLMALATGVRAAADCVGCHGSVTPGAVADWKLSKHAANDIGCDACHGDAHTGAGDVAKVDIIGIVTSQQKSLAAQLKPGMDEKAQAALIDQASRFGKQLDVALAQVVDECKCTLINAAAIVRDAPSGATRRPPFQRLWPA